MRSFVIAPGAAAAGTNITIPFRLTKITAARKFTGSDGTAAATVATLAVASAAPASGEIYLSGENTVQLGDDLTARDQVIIEGIGVGETIANTVKYIGA